MNKLTSRVFKEGKIQAGFNYQVEGSGKIYNKTEDFTNKNLITIQTNDVSLLIKAPKNSGQPPRSSAPRGNQVRRNNENEELPRLYSSGPKDYVIADKIELTEVQE